MTDTVKERLFVQKLLRLMDVYEVESLYPDIVRDICGNHRCESLDVTAKDFAVELYPDDTGCITTKSIKSHLGLYP